MTNIEHVRQLVTAALDKLGGPEQAQQWLQEMVDHGLIGETVADMVEAASAVPWLCDLAHENANIVAYDAEVRKLRQWVDERDVLNQKLRAEMATMAEQLGKARARVQEMQAKSAPDEQMVVLSRTTDVPKAYDVTLLVRVRAMHREMQRRDRDAYGAMFWPPSPMFKPGSGFCFDCKWPMLLCACPGGGLHGLTLPPEAQ